MVPPVWKYIIWYLLNTVRQHFHLLRFYLRYFQIYLCVAPLSSFKICFCRSKNVAPCIHEEPSTDQDHEGISRCKVPQMVSTARADLEDKDTCLFRYSPLSSACSGGLHHRREDVKMHRGILSVTVPQHHLHSMLLRICNARFRSSRPCQMHAYLIRMMGRVNWWKSSDRPDVANWADLSDKCLTDDLFSEGWNYLEATWGCKWGIFRHYG